MRTSDAVIWFIIGLLVSLLFSVMYYGISGQNENAKFHFETITIKGVVCPPNQDFGYIQDISDEIYDIPIEDCKIQKSGDIIAISYKHIHNPYALIDDEWDFNTIVVAIKKGSVPA